MTGTYRTFLALELEPALRTWLTAIQIQLRARPSGADVRWVNPENIHITVKFFGDTAISLIPAITSTMDRITQLHHPIALAASGLGSFPNLERPRVIWVGLNPLRALHALSKDFEDAYRGLGFAEESRPFAPHLTLGRVRDGLPYDRLRRLAGDLRQVIPQPDSLAFTADAVTFFRSELQSRGAVYSAIHKSAFKLP